MKTGPDLRWGGGVVVSRSEAVGGRTLFAGLVAASGGGGTEEVGGLVVGSGSVA
jgi:hypothetical protein